MSKRYKRTTCVNTNPRTIGFKTPAEAGAEKAATTGSEEKGRTKEVNKTIGERLEQFKGRHPKLVRAVKTGGKILGGAALFIAGRMTAKPTKVEVELKMPEPEAEKPEETATEEPEETTTEEE